MRRTLRAGSRYIVFLAIFLLFLTGCGKQYRIEETEDGRTPADENLIVVGVPQLGSESVWRTANTASIKNVFTKENGYFLIFSNARQRQENQIKSLRSFISQRVDYIVFSPITEEGWDTVLKEAKDAGIPVIVIDRKVKVEDESPYTCWIGSDFKKEGQKAGEVLEDLLEEQNRQNEEINIIVLQGTGGASATIGRTAGFDSVVAMHENWKVLEQVDAEFTTAKGKEEMRKILQRHDEIDVVISQNDDMTFGAVEAIQEAGKTTGVDGEIMVISFDAVKAALEMVQAGMINADIECNPEQGEYIERVIEKLGKKEEIEKNCFVPEEVFTQENVGNFIDERTY